MELWRIRVKDWSVYYVAAKDMKEAIRKVKEYIWKDLEDSKVDYVPEELELITDNLLI